MVEKAPVTIKEAASKEDVDSIKAQIEEAAAYGRASESSSGSKGSGPPRETRTSKGRNASSIATIGRSAAPMYNELKSCKDTQAELNWLREQIEMRAGGV